jgi:hypothetical protein
MDEVFGKHNVACAWMTKAGGRACPELQGFGITSIVDQSGRSRPFPDLSLSRPG